MSDMVSHETTRRERENARSYANTYKRRGWLAQMPCIVCGSEHSEMHHEDYSKPLEVHWLCRECHMLCHSDGGDAARIQAIIGVFDATYEQPQVGSYLRPVQANKPCRCGRGFWRLGQRNCYQCNSEANAKLRARLLSEVEARQKVWSEGIAKIRESYFPRECQ